MSRLRRRRAAGQYIQGFPAALLAYPLIAPSTIPWMISLLNLA